MPTTTNQLDNFMNESRQIVVCHLMGSMGMGGRESLLLDIIENSSYRFHHVVVGFRLEEDRRADFEQAGATVRGLNFSSKADFLAYTRLIRAIQRISPDVLHAHGLNAQLPARFLGNLLRISVISTHHGVSEMFPERMLDAERWTRFLDSSTVAVSAGVRESYEPCLFGESWKTVHNGIDVTEFKTAVAESSGKSVRTEYDISPEDTVFLNVGRHVAEKRQWDLIEAMETVTDTEPTARLFIVGGRGGDPSGLRERVEKAGLTQNVFVTGRVEDIHPYYAAADVFTLASIHEGLPIVVLEAMAAERAVVATDIPGVREVIDDGETGVLVPPREPDKLGTAMSKLLSQKSQQRLARAGHERVKGKFSIKATTKGYEELYRKVTE